MYEISQAISCYDSHLNELHESIDSYYNYIKNSNNLNEDRYYNIVNELVFLKSEIESSKNSNALVRIRSPRAIELLVDCELNLLLPRVIGITEKFNQFVNDVHALHRAE